MSNQHATPANNGFNSIPHPSPADSLVSSFGGTDSGFEGSPLFPTVDPSHLSVRRLTDVRNGDFQLFGDDEQARRSVHFADDSQNEDDESLEQTPQTNASSASTTPEQPAQPKKEVKKRKSWGQQLPQPTTNLPPRKRAKTEDEKEQRRIERVLRNRRAAQSSRERKREEAEKLQEEKDKVAKRCEMLEKALRDERARSDGLARQLTALGHRVEPAEPLFIDSSPYQRAADAQRDNQQSSPFPDEVQTPQQMADSLPHLEDNFEQLPPSLMSHQFNPSFDNDFGFYQEINQPKTIDPARLSPQVSQHNSPSISSAMKPTTDSDPTLSDMPHSAEVSDLPCPSDKRELKQNPSWALKLAASTGQYAQLLSTGWTCIKGA